jgi:hypothetical protein
MRGDSGLQTSLLGIGSSLSPSKAWMVGMSFALRMAFGGMSERGSNLLRTYHQQWETYGGFEPGNPTSGDPSPIYMLLLQTWEAYREWMRGNGGSGDTESVEYFRTLRIEMQQGTSPSTLSKDLAISGSPTT